MEGRLTRALAETLGIAESLLGKWAPGASSKVKVRSSSAMPANGSGHHGERCLEVARHLLATHEVKFLAIEALSGRYSLEPMYRLLRVAQTGHDRPQIR